MSRIVARYDYTDSKGTPRLRKLRFDPKGFRMRSADWQDAKGVWHYRNGISDQHLRFSLRALYKLPEVVAALRVDVPVWWVEGEKDAEALSATGLIATTTPNPSDLYDDQARWFTKYRSRSEVLVVCDQDEHGGWWGWERYTALLRVGVAPERITVLTPRSRRHKDVSDVLEAGLGVDAMRPVRLDRLEACADRYSAARARAYNRSTPTPTTRPT